MSKAVLRSIKSYWVFLIIAKAMGWNIPQHKEIEVGKTIPRDKDWNKRVLIYCSKDKQSFNRIPKEYQPLMKPLLGKVIGEFICDKIDTRYIDSLIGSPVEFEQVLNNACLRQEEFLDYYKDNDYYFGYHISNLKIYDKPKELSEFRNSNGETIKRAFQSWGYCYGTSD